MDDVHDIPGPRLVVETTEQGAKDARLWICGGGSINRGWSGGSSVGAISKSTRRGWSGGSSVGAISKSTRRVVLPPGTDALVQQCRRQPRTPPGGQAVCIGVAQPRNKGGGPSDESGLG
jgi:hypothetical protein